MGYYVKLEESDFTIPEREDVLAALREMPKKYHDLKRGGNGTDKWFSWMSDEEIENATSVEAIFRSLGFETMSEDGQFVLVGYDNKMGQEDLFLAVVAPFVSEDSYTEWTGEDGMRWRYVVQNEKLHVQSSTVAWNMPERFFASAFFSEGSFKDNSYKSITLLIDPYLDDISAEVQRKIERAKANA